MLGVLCDVKYSSYIADNQRGTRLMSPTYGRGRRCASTGRTYWYSSRQDNFCYDGDSYIYVTPIVLLGTVCLSLLTWSYLVCTCSKLISFDGEFDAVYDALSCASMMLILCLCYWLYWCYVSCPGSEDQSADAHEMQARVLVPVQPGSSPKPLASNGATSETQLKVCVIYTSRCYTSTC